MAPSSTESQSETLCASLNRKPCKLRRENAVMDILGPAEQAMVDAMIRLSPSPPLRPSSSLLGKRTYCKFGDEDDRDTTKPNTGDAPTAFPALLINDTPVDILFRWVSRKKLCDEQRKEVQEFFEDTVQTRETELYATLLLLENKLDGIRSATPAYQLSEELKTNINHYCAIILLSVNIHAYKGDTLRNHVLDVLKQYCFDLPPGIEHDYAGWEKKLIKDSITSNTNIFILTQLVVQTTACRPTAQLCARVALMRAVFLECNGGEKYWNMINDCLEFIRLQAGSSKRKAAKAFDQVLGQDQLTYGADDDYEIGNTVPSNLQQEVDDIISGVKDETI